MRGLVFLLVVLTAGSSFAAEREAAVGLSAGYSNYSGAVAAVRASFAAKFLPHWQWEAGGVATVYSKYGYTGSGIFTGPVFNFSEDLKSSAFINAGVGYSNQYPFGAGPTSGDQPPAAYGYGSFGWRIPLCASGTVIYKPAITFFYDGKRPGNELRPLELSVLF